MFTALIAVVVALALGHLLPVPLARWRRLDWFGQWIERVDGHAKGWGAWQSRYGVLLVLLPPLLLVLALQWWVDGVWRGLSSLLFGVAILALTWGPRDLDRDVEAVIEAEDAASRKRAIGRLQIVGESLNEDAPSLVEAIVINSLRRWFAVLFWFLLLGPFGAVLYRLTALVVENASVKPLPSRNVAGACGLLGMLEWPVAQCMVMSMALAGNFDAVLRAWRQEQGGRWQLQPQFLAAVARASVSAALRKDVHEDTESGLLPLWRRLPEVRDAMHLVWRMLLLWMVMLALLVIAGWVR